MKPTYAECCASWGLWQEYVDPMATMTEAEFDAMPMDERQAMMVACFGPEPAEDDDAAD